MPWRAQNQQNDWLRKRIKKVEKQSERKSFLEVKAKYDTQNEKKETKYYTDKTFCDFFPLNTMIFFSSFFALYINVFFSLVLYCCLSCYCFIRCCSVLFAFHCALFYLFFLLIVSSPWNVLLTFSVLCCTQQTNTHRKVLNFIQDFYLIRITYNFEQQFLLCFCCCCCCCFCCSHTNSRFVCVCIFFGVFPSTHKRMKKKRRQQQQRQQKYKKIGIICDLDGCFFLRFVIFNFCSGSSFVLYLKRARGVCVFILVDFRWTVMLPILGPALSLYLGLQSGKIRTNK